MGHFRCSCAFTGRDLSLVCAPATVAPKVGIVHRASTRTPPPPAPAAGGGAAAQAQPCGRTMATLPPDGTPGGITHDFQTEGYLIVSGGGTMFTDGYIVNGRHSDQNFPGGPNGPTCGGMAYDVKKVTVKVGVGDALRLPKRHPACRRCGVGISFDTAKLAKATEILQEALEAAPNEITIKFFR
jgi:hypothetical protein